MSVAMGRPLPSFRIRNILPDLMGAVSVFMAAGRVASAVEARRIPAVADLTQLGLDDVPQMRQPFRV
jgi:hypothetical protein